MSDLRASRVRVSVERFLPRNEEEVVRQKRFLEMLDSMPAPFTREADPQHVTGSAVVVSPAGVLLHRHKLVDCWVGPGGHIDEGEWPWEAAVREAFEETGIKAWHPEGEPVLLHLDVHVTPHEPVGHVHFDLRYLLIADADEPAPAPGESQEVAWFPLEEALELTDESFRGAIVAACDLEALWPR